MRISACAVAVLLCSSMGFALPIPTEGLQYQLDASVPSTMIANEAGYVTNWSSCVGSVAFTNEAPDHLPYYDPDAFGGRGGLLFGFLKNGVTNVNWLTATISTDNKSIFFVYKQYLDLSDPKNYKEKTDFGLTYYWGKDKSGGDTDSIKGSVTGNGFYVQSNAGVPCTWQPGGAWIDGKWETRGARDVFFSFDDPHWFYAEVEDVQSHVCAIGNSKHNNQHSTEWRRNAYGAFAEVLVYDRVLSEFEQVYVARYLRLKWFDSLTVWTGAGTTGRWSDPANWSAGVPTAMMTALLDDATVTVDGPIAAAKLITTGCTLNLSGAAEVSIAEIEGFRLDGQNAEIVLSGAGKYAIPLLSDVKLRKTGVGTRLVARMLTTGRADVEVSEGTLAADISPYEMPGLTLRLDASQAGTIETNEAGLVTKWTSLEGHVFTKAPHVAEGMLPRYEPSAAGGRGGVHFGWDPTKEQGLADSRITTGMESSDSFSIVSSFLVYDLTDSTPQKGTAEYPYRTHGVVGQSNDRDCMSMSIYYFDWRGSSNAKLYVAPFYHDGVENWKFGNNTMATVRNSLNVPHVASCCTAQSYAMQGSKPAEVGCSTGSDYPDRYHVGHVYEWLAYDHLLSTNEIEIVQRYLMGKWGVTPAAALTNICDQLPPMRYSVGAAGTLDCGDGDQTFVSLSGAGCVTNVRQLTVLDGVTLSGDMSVFADGFETPSLKLSAAAGFFPCLSLACDWDMTGTALELEPTEDMKRGPIVTSAGELTGPFDSVTGLDGSGKIRYDPNRVVYSCGGLILLFR